MKISSNIDLKNYRNKDQINKIKLKKILSEFLDTNNEILNSLKPTYKNQYSKKLISKYKNYKNINIVGMGGSILGFKAIFNFLKHKIKKKVNFFDNLNSNISGKFQNFLNIIISKSGNTLETIANISIILKRNRKNIFITENKKSYLRLLALKLKSEIIDHNNFIGGRYSVLSEVGMLPVELVGLKVSKFKQLNNLIKNKKFLDSLINNVIITYNFIGKKKFNSLILNYDEKSDDFLKWYQQLVAESLGKNKKGVLPIISTMPKDNHSMMQLFLDGPKVNFYTFFDVKDQNSNKLNYKGYFNNYKLLKDKKLQEIKQAQRKATENVFLKKNIPFRSFYILNRTEETLGELFCFFILETILLAKMMNVNPYDQPSVELIKKETFKILN